MTHLCRRTLLRGAAVACGAGVLAACSSSETAPTPGTPAGGASGAAAGGGALGKVADIPVGGAISVEIADGSKVLLTQAAAGDIKGFSASCPHEGCTTSPDGDTLSCPCHGSRFGLDGSVLQGPAGRGLTPIPVKILNGQVLPA